MPVICHSFTQNAWKKDLCSNCFKSKEEHSPESLNGITKRFTSTITSTLHNNNINNNNNNKIIKNGISNGDCHEEQPQSIMKTETKKNVKSKRNVCFPKEESHVIGYGGEDWSDSEEFELSTNNEDDDVGPDNDAERELQRLTKSNTDFNMINSNLLNGDAVNGVETDGKKSSSETPRRTFAQLMLGKPQTDAEGKKQTLLVSVTPFGEQESPPSSLRKATNVPLTNGSLVKNEKKSNIIKNKDSIIENGKPTVILKSFSPKIDTDIVTDSTPDSSLSSSSNDEEKSLLDEITETLEKNKSLIQMKNTKNEAQILDIEAEKNKENVPVSNEFIQTKAECVFINGDGNADKKPKNGLTRHTAVIKRDHEKPVIYQSYNLRSEIEKPDLIEAKSPILVKTEIKFISEATANLRKADGQISKIEPEENLPKFPEENLPIFNIEVVASRESAGEPDGRADPDVPSEPPALPLTPPPSVTTPQSSPDPRSSFLHNSTKRSVEKPKVPVKPNKLLLPPLAISPVKKSPTPEENTTPPEIENPYESLPPKSLLSKQDSTGSDLNRNPNKRRAPKPPSPTDSPNEQTISATSIYYRNTTNTNSDSPVVREKEKRERASSCSPKFRTEINSNPTGDSTPNLTLIPEPAPRRSLSLSQDNLINATITPPIDEKKKNRGRFSLKKFLRMGSNNISTTNTKDSTQSLTKLEESIKPVLPQPKPRLVIIHPIDLNGSNIEVLKSNNDHSEDINQTPSRPCKPPPPPRNIDDSKEKLNRAPPPPIKTEELIRHQKLWNTNNPSNTTNQYQPKDNIYANVGEVRAALTPSKPVRTASMREREAALLEAQKRRNIIEHNYESVEIRRRTSDHVYDFVNGQRSSSPECDSTNKDNAKTILNQNGFARPILNSNHHQYCGSETESEIYSPYSFYGSEVDGGDDDSEWTNSGARTYKLRSRKGRSVVHKNLEDNYGAVVVANHEALAQVLEHMNQSPFIQPALRGLKTVTNLRWTDFAIVDGVTPSGMKIGRRCFHTALWGAHHVTLALTKDQGSLLQTPALPLPSITTLLPITEFNDLVPMQYVTGVNSESSDLTQATIAVLPWMQIDTIQSIGSILRSKSTQSAVLPSSPVSSNTNDSVAREAYFVLLQLINGLKCLQAQGIEELPLSLTSFALCRDVERDIHPRLCLIQGLSEEISSQNSTSNNPENGASGSLCECALAAIKQLLPVTNLTSLLEDLLRRERAVSLTQVKSILEFSLWGPSDVTTTTPVKDRELALQRWLDLERATVLHGLVRTRVQLTVFEECHLLFLVRSSAKMMCEASVILDSIEMNNPEKHC